MSPPITLFQWWSLHRPKNNGGHREAAVYVQSFCLLLQLYNCFLSFDSAHENKQWSWYSRNMLFGYLLVTMVYRPWGFLLFPLRMQILLIVRGLVSICSTLLVSPSSLLFLSYHFFTCPLLLHFVYSFDICLSLIPCLFSSLNFSPPLLVSQVSFGCNSRTPRLSESHSGTQRWHHCNRCNWWVQIGLKQYHGALFIYLMCI